MILISTGRIYGTVQSVNEPVANRLTEDLFFVALGLRRRQTLKYSSTSTAGVESSHLTSPYVIWALRLHLEGVYGISLTMEHPMIGCLGRNAKGPSTTDLRVRRAGFFHTHDESLE